MSENSYNEENTIDVDFEITSEVDVQVGTVYQSGASTLAGLSDVNLTTPSDGQALTYDNTSNKWINTTIEAGATIDDTTTSSTETWSSQKISTELGAKANSLDLAVVATTGSFDDLIDKPDAGDISYDNTSSGLTAIDVQSAIDEVAAGGGGGATALDGLSDVDITSGSLGTHQVLMYDGGTGKWANRDISMSGGGGSGNISDVSATTPLNNDVLMWSGTYDDWENQPIRLGGYYDAGNVKDVYVNSSTLSNKDILIYDSTNDRWENKKLYKEVTGTLTAGSTSITLQETSITSNSTIDIYTADGTEWNSITVATGSVTITFDAQSSDLGVKVRIS